MKSNATIVLLARYSLMSILIALAPQKLSAQNNSWVQTNGPYGAGVNSILIDSTGSLLASTDGGLYQSTDNGLHWVCIGFPDSNVTGLVATKEGKIFAIANRACYFSDNAVSWNKLNIPSSPGTWYGQSIAIALGHQDEIYLLCYYQDTTFFTYVLLRSTDNGNTWADLGLRDKFAGPSLTVDKNGNIYVGSEGPGYVFRSTNNGATWSYLNFTGRIYCLAVDSMSNVFVGSDTGIYVSTDNCNSWHLSGLKNSIFLSLYVAPSGTIFASAIYPEKRVYYSTDDGATWVPTKFTFQTSCFASRSNGDIFAGTSYDGVFRSTDNGISWTQASTGMVTNTIVTSFAVAQNNSLFAGVAGNGSGLWKTTNQGETWSRIAFTDTSASVFTDSAGRIYTCTNYGVYMSADGGSTWEKIYTGATNCGTVDPDGRIFLGSDNFAICRSTDGGKTWTPLQTSLQGKGDVHSIAICRDTSVVAATTGGLIRSTDHGDTWTTVVPAAEMNCLLVDEQGTVFAAPRGLPVIRSTDNGETWSKVQGDLSPSEVKSLAVNSAGWLFAGTCEGIIITGSENGNHIWYAGVFMSTDKGNSWTQFNSGLTYLNIQTLGFDSHGYLYAGPFLGHAIYRTSIPTPVEERPKNMPEGYNLSQNHPNPFNLSTRISYSVPKSGSVTVAVYNVLGQRVATLFSGQALAGEYEVTFNADGLTSGIYFCRMAAPGFSRTVKMMLLK